MKTFLLFSFFYLAYHTTESVKLTYYWQVRETDFKTGSDSVLATCPNAGSKELAKVSKQFADRIAVEGSGYLKDGRFLSLSSCVGENNPCKRKGNRYSCFEKGTVPVGSRDNELVPLVSVATNQQRFGTVGIIKQFVNKKTPKGETHNGCVRVDDSCSTCEEKSQFDFYAYTKKNADYFERNWVDSEQQIDFVPQNCKLGKYAV